MPHFDNNVRRYGGDMIFGTPVTWFLAEVLTITLFLASVAHALRQPAPTARVMELLAALFYTAVFENIGVYTQTYDYNLHRVMLIGRVPIEILMCEVSILYAATQLVRRLRVPVWAMPLAVGFLCSFQDVSLDPSAVFDRSSFDGQLSGQWNWPAHYEGGLFGIPYFNFTGWMMMMAYYVGLTMLGERLAERVRRPAFTVAYPFIAAIAGVGLLVSPLTRFLLFASPFVAQHNKSAELVLLIIVALVGVVALGQARRLEQPFDFRRDAILIVTPMALHLFDIGVAFALELPQARIASTLTTVLHIVFFAFFLIPKLSARDRPDAQLRAA